MYSWVQREGCICFKVQHLLLGQANIGRTSSYFSEMESQLLQQIHIQVGEVIAPKVWQLLLLLFQGHKATHGEISPATTNWSPTTMTETIREYGFLAKEAEINFFRDQKNWTKWQKRTAEKSPIQNSRQITHPDLPYVSVPANCESLAELLRQKGGT